ncbi:hypothetical protein [Phyllobacterium sp. UNC302MFCol5.2]|uniref:hypothetical protein n=1 Tax=Phyllobacterium sp. UNC302MFCol5.2 TaxID=1449065 RepID=UPI000487BF72|nr:hypothetical protein [Phyllobacterium sp. UNC302MFCol5.2]
MLETAGTIVGVYLILFIGAGILLIVIAIFSGIGSFFGGIRRGVRGYCDHNSSIMDENHGVRYLVKRAKIVGSALGNAAASIGHFFDRKQTLKNR